jgi:putative MATE family efflux protein
MSRRRKTSGLLSSNGGRFGRAARKCREEGKLTHARQTESGDSKTGFLEIIKLALPVSLEAVFQTSLSLVDQVIVGFLGASAVAAVGLSNSLSFVIMLFYSGLGTGTGVLVAQAFGRRDIQEVSKLAGLGQTIAGMCGACTAIPLVLFPEAILHGIGAQENIAKVGAEYFQLFAASTPFMATSAVTTATFRSLSDTRTPMVITIGAVALNTVLGFCLVLGVPPFPRLQVAGAGVAALLAQTVRCAALIIVLYRRKKGPTWKWPWETSGYDKILKSLLRITYPLALSEMLWGISAFVYTLVFARLGTPALAASQIVMTVENLFIVCASGLAPAAVATVGQAIGADSICRAKSQAGAVLHLGILAGLLFTALLSGASFLLPIMYPNVGKDVIAFAFWGLIIVAGVQPAKVLNSVLGNGILPSGEDTKFVLEAHVIGSYLVGLPAAVLLSIFTRLNVWGVYGSRATEEIIKSILFVLRFRTHDWYRKNQLSTESRTPSSG